MNYRSDTNNQNLRLITKNDSIRLKALEDTLASPSSKDPIQLELDFNQPTTHNH